MATENFDDKDFVDRYVAQGPSLFVPGFEALHRMTGLLLAEFVPEDGAIFIVGAGGGHELMRLSAAQKSWRFCAVDPSVIENAPDGPFDAATCLLTLHLVADDGGKLATLRSIRARLKPEAPFVLVDLCMDRAAADFEQALGRYARFAEESGAEAEAETA